MTVVARLDLMLGWAGSSISTSSDVRRRTDWPLLDWLADSRLPRPAAGDVLRERMGAASLLTFHGDGCCSDERSTTGCMAADEVFRDGR